MTRTISARDSAGDSEPVTSRDDRLPGLAVPQDIPPGSCTSLLRILPAKPLHELINRERRSGASLSDLGIRWAVDRRTLQRLLVKAFVRGDSADRMAAAMGRHPSEIWPEWFGTGSTS